jgi:16S rRNA (guanine527-N7)-methyltransferase
MAAEVISYDVSRETFETAAFYAAKFKTELNHYVGELIWWNNRINLMSRTISRQVIEEHVFHSLLMIGFDAFHESNYLVDIGSGGGLPGIPLAICEREKNFIFNDIVQKKCVALKDLSHKVGLVNAQVIEGDISKVSIPPEYRTYISKHAFKMPEVVSLIGSKPWDRILMLKGSDLFEEAKGLSDGFVVRAYALETGTIKSFYKGKYFVELERVK